MDFSLALSQFLDSLRIERALSRHTVAAYGRDLEAFSLFIDKKPEEIVEGDIAAYLLHLKSAGFKQTSINRALSSLRTFFQYLAREYDYPNPSAGLGAGKIPRRLPKALSFDEILRLIEASWNEFDATSLRSRALLELLYGTGARVSEIVGLNLSDFSQIDSDGESVPVVKLTGKGSKERIVPLGRYALEALDDYVVRLRPTYLQGKSNPALFLNRQGGRLSRVSAWNIVKESAKRAGLEERVSPHVFRHSYATHLLDGGADIRVVQELLGHASVTTTQIYTLITIDKVRESYVQAHPRSR